MGLPQKPVCASSILASTCPFHCILLINYYHPSTIAYIGSIPHHPTICKSILSIHRLLLTFSLQFPILSWPVSPHDSAQKYQLFDRQSSNSFPHDFALRYRLYNLQPTHLTSLLWGNDFSNFSLHPLCLRILLWGKDSMNVDTGNTGNLPRKYTALHSSALVSTILMLILETRPVTLNDAKLHCRPPPIFLDFLDTAPR